MGDQWGHLPGEGERVTVTYTSNQPDVGEQTKTGRVTKVLRVDRGKFWLEPEDGPNTLEVEAEWQRRVFSMSPARTTPIGTMTDYEVVDG